jgi:hypothetical protein
MKEKYEIEKLGQANKEANIKIWKQQDRNLIA